jgi:hypothetical protein
MMNDYNWLPVDKYPPPLYEEVLGLFQSPPKGNYEYGVIEILPNTITAEPITHWMYLPPPPYRGE